jgi:hypothetical protein
MFEKVLHNARGWTMIEGIGHGKGSKCFTG